MPAAAFAQAPGFVGKWKLELDMGRNPSYGILEIEQSGGGLAAYIDGGPVHLLGADANHIRFDLDWTDGGDRLRYYVLDGDLAGGRLSGSFTEEDKPIGTWSATPWMEHPDAGKPPAPLDFSGVWTVLSRGTHKDAFALTPEARAINDAYDPTLDDPHLRCVAGGVIRMEDGPFPHQIIQLDDEIIILYEYFHQVRHIWMDGRDFPEDIEYAYLDMGYSIGHWEGSTLVVETRGMKPTVWDAGGMPVSPPAVITERKYLDDDGRLHADYTLVDPAYYERPIYRHAYWGPGQNAEISENACDPHSFYRSLDLEGRLETYWGRSENRL
jgi:hypothetical protein